MEVKHKSEIDVLRIAAVCAVVMIHIAAVYSVKVETCDELIWRISLIYNCASRWAVPVFVMISGVLILNLKCKEMIFTCPISFYRRRFAKILVPMLFFSVAYMVIRYVRDGVLAEQLFIDLVCGRPYYHLWFLYMIAMLYLCVPVIGYFYFMFPERVVFLVAAFCVLGAPYFGGWVYGVIPYIGYFLIGRLAYEYKTNIWALLTIAFLATCAIIIFSIRNPQHHLQYLGYCHLLVFSQACSLFKGGIDLLKGIELGYKWRQRLYHCAMLSFGVYLVHPVVKGIFAPLKNAYLSNVDIIGILHIEFLFVVVVSFFICDCLSRTKLKILIGL